MSDKQDDLTAVLFAQLSRRMTQDPLEALADLSVCMAASLALMRPAAWEELQLILAYDGTGTEQCVASQSALLHWLRAEREWGLMKLEKPIPTDG